MKKYFIPEAKCQGCVKKIASIIKKNKSISKFDFDLEAKTLSIDTSAEFNFNNFSEKIKELGYTINEIS